MEAGCCMEAKFSRDSCICAATRSEAMLRNFSREARNVSGSAAMATSNTRSEGGLMAIDSRSILFHCMHPTFPNLREA